MCVQAQHQNILFPQDKNEVFVGINGNEQGGVTDSKKESGNVNSRNINQNLVKIQLEAFKIDQYLNA